MAGVYPSWYSLANSILVGSVRIATLWFAVAFAGSVGCTDRQDRQTQEVLKQPVAGDRVPAHTDEPEPDMLPQRTLSVPAVDAPPLPLIPADDLSQTPVQTPAGEGGSWPQARQARTVFFATDRMETTALLPGTRQVFLPILPICLVTLAAWVGLLFARKHVGFWLLGAGLSLCIFLMAFQYSGLRWQSIQHLAQSPETLFSERPNPDSNRVYPLSLGMASVAIHLESQLGSDAREKPQARVWKASTEKSTEAWFAALRNREAPNNLLLYIHGQGTDFSASVKQAALIADQIRMNGPTICYSWPTELLPGNDDLLESQADWSSPHLTRLVQDLSTQFPETSIQIVAEGHGGRLVGSTMHYFASRRKASEDTSQDARPQIGVENVVYLAPATEGLAAMRSAADANIATHITFYFHHDDAETIDPASRLEVKTDSVDGVAVETIVDLIHTQRRAEGDWWNLGWELRRALTQNVPASECGYLRDRGIFTGGRVWRLEQDAFARVARNVDVGR